MNEKKNQFQWLISKSSSKLQLFRLQTASAMDMQKHPSSRFVRPFTVANEIAALRCAATIIKAGIECHKQEVTENFSRTALVVNPEEMYITQQQQQKCIKLITRNH